MAPASVPLPLPLRAWIAPAVTHGTYFYLDLRTRSRPGWHLAFGGRESCDESYRLERQTYPFYTLEFIAEGFGQVSLGGGPEQVLRPGAVFIHGPSLPVTLHTAAGSTLIKYFLCLSGQGVRRELARHGLEPGLVGNISALGEMREWFQALLREAATPHPQTEAVCRHLSALILLKMAQRRSPQHPHATAARDRFQHCKDYLDAHCLTLSSIEEAAHHLHLDPASLSRLFRQHLGQSPYHYLLQRRMNLAAHELLASNALIKTIAARCGYPDPYHFSRLFKRTHGLSPDAYRRLRT